MPSVKDSGWSILTLPSTDSSKHGLLGFAATLAGIPNVAGKQRQQKLGSIYRGSYNGDDELSHHLGETKLLQLESHILSIRIQRRRGKMRKIDMETHLPKGVFWWAFWSNSDCSRAERQSITWMYESCLGPFVEVSRHFSHPSSSIMGGSPCLKHYDNSRDPFFFNREMYQ